MKRIGFMTRLTPDNHQWLDQKAKSEDRSMTYVVDRLVSQAREADQEKGDLTMFNKKEDQQ